MTASKSKMVASLKRGTASQKFIKFGISQIFRGYLVCIFCSSLLRTCLATDIQKVCTKVTNCVCETDKGVIDLMPVYATDEILLKEGYLTAKDTTNPDLYYYQPCFPIGSRAPEKVPNEKCRGTTVCQKRGKEYFDCGDPTAEFYGHPDTGLFINYTSTINPKKLRITNLRLTCDKSATKNELIFINETKPESAIYLMELKSRFACLIPKQSSTSAGTVIIIIILVIVFIYFIGGMLFLKIARGAVWPEVVPHYAFWSDVPFLIRDGFMFLANGCKADSAYDQI